MDNLAIEQAIIDEVLEKYGDQVIADKLKTLEVLLSEGAGSLRSKPALLLLEKAQKILLA